MQSNRTNAHKRQNAFLPLLIVAVTLATVPSVEAKATNFLIEAEISSQLAQAQSSEGRSAEVDRWAQQGAEQYRARQYDAALRSWQQALALYREMKDPMGEGQMLNNLGLVYYKTENYGKAIESFEQSLTISRSIGDRLGEGKTLTNLGLVYNAMRNYSKAIEYQQQSLVIKREVKDRLGEGKSLINLANIYDAVGDYSKAIQYLEQSLAIAREFNDRTNEMVALGNLGNAYYNKEEYTRALKYSQQVLSIARELKSRRDEGYALASLGNTYEALGDLKKAIEYQEQALKIVREFNDRQVEGIILTNLGNAYNNLGNYNKAIEYQRQALNIAREFNDRLGEARALNNLGLDLVRAKRLPEAERSFLESIQAYESLRQGLQDAQKVSIADTQRNPYTNLQRVLIAQNKVEFALEAAERGRARAFAELLAQRTQSREPATLQPIRIEAIKRIAREQNATLIEYSNIYNEQLYIWVIKPTGEVAFRQVDLTSLKQQKTSLNNLIATARCLGVNACEQVVASRGSNSFAFNTVESDRQFTVPLITKTKQEHLYNLHKLLIEPISDLLPTDPKQLIVFIPQDRLFLIPFAALQNEQGQYLIEQHTIATAPSIQVLQLTRKKQQRPVLTGENILLVGNPTMPSITVNPGAPPKALISLPGAEKEARAIAKLLNVPALIGSQATKAAVLKLMPNARIIHLATHGLLDDLSGQGVPGAIALAPSSTKPNDGLLTADEILKPDFKLQAEMVVLSACDTGQGKITGDGVIGLSRSLITAGVPSVIVSLWAVPDAPTADLMTQFYQNLQQGQNKAQALRQAMLDTQKDFPDPRAWAAFTLIGAAE